MMKTIVVLLVQLIFSFQLYAAILEVGSSHTYAKISDAINVAKHGDQIHVHPGLYRERLSIDKSISLIAQSGTIIDGMDQGSVITVNAGPCEIRGFTIRGSGESLVSEDSGIMVQHAANCIIENNQLEDVLFGIFILSSPNATIIGNRIIGKDLVPARRGDGIRAYDSSNITIERNLVERSRDLAIWQSNHAVVKNNIIRTSRYGLHYMYCDDSLFEDNRFEDNQVGSAIMYSRRLTLRKNSFTGSRGVGGVGLFIKVGDDVLAENNRITDNARAIFLEEAPQAPNSTCIIRKNLVAGNDIGVSMQPSIERAVFTENIFAANRIQVEVMGGVIKPKDFSLSGKGNYWSDYIGFDENQDNVGDTPYQIEQFFEALAVRWPELGLLRMGPATEALEMGARAFPLGHPRTVAIDKHPLIIPPNVVEMKVANKANATLLFPGLLLSGCCSLMLKSVLNRRETTP